jgi:hypothetical protein
VKSSDEDDAGNLFDLEDLKGNEVEQPQMELELAPPPGNMVVVCEIVWFTVSD